MGTDISTIKTQMEFFINENSTYWFDKYIKKRGLKDKDLIKLRVEFNYFLIECVESVLFDGFLKMYDLEDEDLFRLRGDFNSILIEILEVNGVTHIPDRKINIMMFAIMKLNKGC